jgi:polygalacturonase
MKPVWLSTIFLTLIWHTGCANVQRAPFNVCAFGATGNGTTKDTAAFQKALDTCAAAGGIVLVPAGNYLIGSIELKSHTILLLKPDAHLLGSSDLEDYPMIKVRWEGKWIDFCPRRGPHCHPRAGKNFRQSGARRTTDAAPAGPHRAD